MSAGTIRRLLLATGAAALALGAGAGTASAATARIAYLDFTASGDQIFTVHPDATHVHQVTNFDNGTLGGPSWGPKQKKLVFARSVDAPSHLFTIRSNGFGLKKIAHTTYAGDPSWSPNGKRIAFTMERKKDFKLAVFTIAVNGKHRHRLTAWSNKIAAPDWSPSSKSIVYVGPKGIIRMRANGTHKKLVRKTGFSPSWSPDGKRIAFSDNASDPDATSDVYTVRLNNKGLRNLTGTRPGTTCPDEPLECARNDEAPAWSPNGKRVVFDEFTTGNGDAGIFTVKSSDGSGAKQVTPTGSNADW